MKNNQTQNSMNRIVQLDKSQNRQSLVKPEPLFTDTFVCTVGEHRCPIKRENKEQEQQLSIKDNEIYAKQRELESLRKEIGDKAIEDLKDDQIKKLFKSINESQKTKGFEDEIQFLRNQIAELQSNLNDRNEIINKLQNDIDEFNQTVLEADMHQRKKIQEYRQLTKRCNELTVRNTQKEKILSKLERSIHGKNVYDSKLTVAINEKVDSIRTLDQEIAKKRIEHQRYEKVKPTTTSSSEQKSISTTYGKQNLLKRLFRKIFKRRNQS